MHQSGNARPAGRNDVPREGKENAYREQTPGTASRCKKSDAARCGKQKVMLAEVREGRRELE